MALIPQPLHETEADGLNRQTAAASYQNEVWSVFTTQMSHITFVTL